MNRKSFSISLLALFALMAVSSCEELEPASWTESIHRVATVRQNGENAYLAIDYSGESFNLKNFRKASDMTAFGVHDGDRILASMTYTATGSAQNATFTLDSIHPIDVLKFEESRPSDTLNHYYEMDVLELASVRYPAIWNAGHIVNVAPVFYAPAGEMKADFFLYPVNVSNDTLFVRMYSFIPDDDVSLHPKYRQRIINCDVSSLTDSVSDPMEQARRSMMVNSLRALDNDHIYVTIMTPSTLRAKNSKNPSGGYKYEQDVPGLPKTVRIPFDF